MSEPTVTEPHLVIAAADQGWHRRSLKSQARQTPLPHRRRDDPPTLRTGFCLRIHQAQIPEPLARVIRFELPSHARTVVKGHFGNERSLRTSALLVEVAAFACSVG